ncbi:nucleotidyltransferase [Latilactobacillus sakei]|uniref:nucleotidyltransferase domain-containing protein n=1 Tax=Latilactobacillus sakei TaxID=1599 RepID=UPI00388B80E4
MSEFYEGSLEELVKHVELSQTARKTIEGHYNMISQLVDNNFEGKVEVFPQGSYKLNTAVRPHNGSEDDYDVDIVVKSENIMDPEELRNKIYKILINHYGADKVEEKKRAFRVDFNGSHVDVVPAIDSQRSDIEVTNRKEDFRLEYLPSSPQKLITWFKSKGELSQGKVSLASIEPLTPLNGNCRLSKVVKLLKFHRDNYFDEHINSEFKPISMIITIISGQVIERDSKTLEEALKNVVNSMRRFLEDSKDECGIYHIFNPINKKEDFADKWTTKVELKTTFFEWLGDLEKTFLFEVQNRQQVKEVWSSRFGEDLTQNVMTKSMNINADKIKSGELSVVHGQIIKETNKNIEPHTFYGSEVLHEEK